MSRRPRRDRPARLPTRTSTPTPRLVVAATPDPPRRLVHAGVAGPHPTLGREEMLAAARRLTGPAAPLGLEGPAVSVEEVTDALAHVAGPQDGPRVVVDPHRVLAAATRAGTRLALAARRAQRIAFATAAPASLLPLYGALVRHVRAGGADVPDGLAAGPYGPGRSIWWHDGVATARDGAALVAETRREAADEWLFAVGRPDLAVADGIFARQAQAEGLETVAFADLDDALPAVAEHRGRPVVVVPIVTTRPPGAYEALLEAILGPLGAASSDAAPAAHGGDLPRHGPHLATETPGPYAAPPSGGEG